MNSGSDRNTFFDSNCCIMSLNCTSDELGKAFEHLDKYGETVPVLRDFLHEHAHHIQFATTTVGYYLNLIHNYQFQRLRTCCTYVMQSKEKVYPLFKSILNIKTRQIVNKKAAHHYYYWALGEMIRLNMWGELNTINEYLEYMMQGEGLHDYYAEMDEALKRLYGIPKAGNSNFGPASDELEDMLKVSMFHQMAASVSLATIIESEALLAEYWYDEVADERLIRLLNRTKMTADEQNYLYPLILYKSVNKLDLIDRNDFLSFKLGFHAICQIVLNSPLLPFQEKEVFMPEIDVSLKFIMLLFHSEIPLPKTKEDYDGYIEEIVRKFQIKSLKENYNELKQNENLLMNRILFPFTFKEEVYISAQNIYNLDPLYYYQFLNGKYSKRSMFSIKFTDCDLDYPTDRIMYLLYESLRKYYEELLYGYNYHGSKSQIEVYTPVKLSRQTMEELGDLVDLYNMGLKVQDPNLPLLIINNS